MSTDRGLILIVDDDEVNLLLLNALLVREGYKILQATNGREAVDTFERESPDLVLLDLMMPVMDGYEAARIIKASSPERFVPVIFLTAVSD